MYNRILVPLALSGQGGVGRGLVERAHALLEKGGSITLLHVMEELPSYLVAAVPREHLANRRKDMMKRLESLAAPARSDKVDIDIRSGNAPKNILEAAAQIDADLIILGSHRPGLSDYFIGSTAARVVRHAQCSVLVMR